MNHTRPAGDAAQASPWQAPDPGVFADAELDGLPDPVRRHLHAAIAPGTALTQTARLRMTGHIKLGRWLSFRAVQIPSPRRGFVWTARVGGVITGWDRYADGVGAMRWAVAGIVPLMRAEGSDVTRSAVGRLAAEAVWLPTALLPRGGARWYAEGPDRVTVTQQLDGECSEVPFGIDAVGHATSVELDRWGDPDATGTWGLHRFGSVLTDSRTFGGLTVPTRGRIGWHYGTPRWPDGEFFRFQVTALEPCLIEPV